jgi:hypothetical protein
MMNKNDARMSLLLISLIVLLTYVSVPTAEAQQNVTSPEQPRSPVDSIVDLIVSIATAAAVVGSLVAGVAGFLKARTHDPEISKALNDIADVGKLTTTFSQKTVEQQGELRTVVQTMSDVNPQIKQALEEKQKDITYWQTRVDVAQQQLSRLISLVPKEAQANAIADLPREPKPVSPAS